MTAGAPTKYKDEYKDQAYKLCLLGHKDTEIADYFGVTEKTLNNWKSKHPKFLQSLKDGKDIADYNVAEKLYHRAIGYKAEDEVKTETDSEGNVTKTIVTTKTVGQDTTAAIFWLKNRQSGKWRDKQDINHTGEITYNCDYGTTD